MEWLDRAAWSMDSLVVVFYNAQGVMLLPFKASVCFFLTNTMAKLIKNLRKKFATQEGYNLDNCPVSTTPSIVIV